MTSQTPSQNSSRTSTGAISHQTTLVGGSTPPSQPPGEAYTRVINKFRARLTGPEFTAIDATTYEELCRTLSRVQREQQVRGESMNLARIQRFLEAMQQFGQVIEIFLNVSNVVAFVWGPMKFLLLTASTFADSFETLLDAYEQIGEQLPLLAEYESLFHKSPHIMKVLEKIYTDILDFHLQSMKFFAGKLWTRFFRSMWKDFNTKFDGILRKLSRHKDLLESQARLVQYTKYQEDSQASLVQYRKYEDDMKELKTKLEDDVNREQAKKMIMVKEWLSVGEQPKLDHNDYRIIRGECATTTYWILQHETIKHWIDSDIPGTPIVWMYGIPGAGKTILASAIIDKCKQKTDFITCYFYCHYGDRTSDSAVGILKGLADQLLDQHPQMLPPCYTRRASSGEPSLRSLSHAKKLLEDFCDTIPKLFIVIDGLDECEGPERKQLLEILTEVVCRCDMADPGQLRLLVVSQDYADIRRGLHSSGATKIVPKVLRVTDADNKSDIQAYTKMHVDRIAGKFSPFTDDMSEYLRNLTVANADGMFLYAKLVLVNLYAMPTRADLLDAIKADQFPKGLAGAYERILRRIKSELNDKWPHVQKLLGWLVCAKRRLTWKEIQVALSIDIEKQTIDYDNHHMREHIYDTCGSLILINGDRVSLVHTTAKEYITKITQDIHEPSIECELATLCLYYLTFPCFDIDDPQDEKELRQLALEGQFAFQDYAVAKWFHHVNAWASNGVAFLNEATDQKMQLDGLFRAMDEFMDRYSEVDWEGGLVDDCKASCSVFAHHDLHDHIVQLTSHIYTFQQKGFEARHKVSIESLAKALERNRKILEGFPKSKPSPSEQAAYNRFYDEEKRFKCTKITCRFFSEGFKEERARKRHVNNHDRPFQCEVLDCLGVEGFANQKDLEKHIRAFHPDMSDLAEKFNSAFIKRETNHACTLCGKTFTRNFHRKNHELAHQGKKPHECAECGRAFTRANDLKRHQKIHDRVNAA